ncbi:MAG: hypothetical protein KJ687_10850 [Proteobacteria bacterium]|nr:hypothetical protein [Pseudomonadota bacterium]
MFSIFPSQWNQPLPRGLKPIKSLADHHFPPRTVTISRPVPASVPKVVKTPVKIQIPESEMCIGENNDFSDVDRMLAEMDNPSADAKVRQMMEMIRTVSGLLQKNINVIQNAPAVDGDTVSREDLLRLLQMFSNYSKTLEDYFKSINQVQTL